MERGRPVGEPTTSPSRTESAGSIPVILSRELPGQALCISMRCSQAEADVSHRPTGLSNAAEARPWVSFRQRGTRDRAPIRTLAQPRGPARKAPIVEHQLMTAHLDRVIWHQLRDEIVKRFPEANASYLFSYRRLNTHGGRCESGGWRISTETNRIPFTGSDQSRPTEIHPQPRRQAPIETGQCPVRTPPLALPVMVCQASAASARWVSTIRSHGSGVDAAGMPTSRSAPRSVWSRSSASAIGSSMTAQSCARSQRWRPRSRLSAAHAPGFSTSAVQIRDRDGCGPATVSMVQCAARCRPRAQPMTSRRRQPVGPSRFHQRVLRPLRRSPCRIDELAER